LIQPCKYNTEKKSDLEIEHMLWRLSTPYKFWERINQDKQSVLMGQERQRITVLQNVLKFSLTKEACEQWISKYRDQYYHTTNPSIQAKLWGRIWTLLWVINVNENIRPREGY
jgi:phosphodiesterase/alkaline phosphatase D-like protein